MTHNVTLEICQNLSNPIVFVNRYLFLVTVHPPLAPHWRGTGTLPDNPVRVLNPDRVSALWRVGELLPIFFVFAKVTT